MVRILNKFTMRKRTFEERKSNKYHSLISNLHLMVKMILTKFTVKR